MPYAVTLGNMSVYKALIQEKVNTKRWFQLAVIISKLAYLIWRLQ